MGATVFRPLNTPGVVASDSGSMISAPRRKRPRPRDPIVAAVRDFGDARRQHLWALRWFNQQRRQQRPPPQPVLLLRAAENLEAAKVRLQSAMEALIAACVKERVETDWMPSLRGAPIERMIDEASGRTDADCAAFVAFVYEYVWTRLPPEGRVEDALSLWAAAKAAEVNIDARRGV